MEIRQVRMVKKLAHTEISPFTSLGVMIPIVGLVVSYALHALANNAHLYETSIIVLLGEIFVLHLKQAYSIPSIAALIEGQTDSLCSAFPLIATINNIRTLDKHSENLLSAHIEAINHLSEGEYSIQAEVSEMWNDHKANNEILEEGDSFMATCYIPLDANEKLLKQNEFLSYTNHSYGLPEKKVSIKKVFILSGPECLKNELIKKHLKDANNIQKAFDGKRGKKGLAVFKVDFEKNGQDLNEIDFMIWKTKRYTRVAVTKISTFDKIGNGIWTFTDLKSEKDVNSSIDKFNSIFDNAKNLDEILNELGLET
jgi:hypothetical protein